MGRGSFYLVERLVAIRKTKTTGGREFRVRWQGYSPKHDSWVAEKDLQGEASTFALSPKVAKALRVKSKTPKKAAAKKKKAPPQSDTGSTQGDEQQNNGGKAGDGQVEVPDSDGTESKIATAAIVARLQASPRTPRLRKKSDAKKTPEKSSEISARTTRRSGRLKLPKKRPIEEIHAPSQSTTKKKPKPVEEPEEKKESGKNGEFWAVERILGMRKKGDVREFKIRWKGFSWRFDNWVPEDDLLEPLLEFPMAASLKRKIKQDIGH